MYVNVSCKDKGTEHVVYHRTHKTCATNEIQLTKY